MAEPKPSRLIPFAIAGSALLAIGAAVLFYAAMQRAPAPAEGQAHLVVVGDQSCEPMDFTLPAGRTSFEIRNASARPIEWEILEGVMVVEERENILPGYSSRLTARLRPGEYEITCGLLSNPRGRLVVTPSEASEAARLAPPVTAFIGPLSEYRVQLRAGAAALSARVAALQQQIAAGDRMAAQVEWAHARLAYKGIEPVAGLFADLEARIDPLPDFLALHENDPGFTGFHRIEAGLWGSEDPAALAPVAEALAEDIAALEARIREMRLRPEQLAGNAARQAERLAALQSLSGESRASGHDIAELQASLAAMEGTLRLLSPLISGADAALSQRLDTAFSEASAELARLEGPAPLPARPEAERQALSARFADLAAALAAVNPLLGLE